MKFKSFVFLVVCVLGILGGIFAAKALNNRSTPPEIFWLVIGGGCAVVGFTFLLADKFGYINLPDSKVMNPDKPAEDGEYSASVSREARTVVAYRGDPNVM